MRGGESRASAFKVELTALVRRMAAIGMIGFRREVVAVNELFGVWKVRPGGADPPSIRLIMDLRRSNCLFWTRPEWTLVDRMCSTGSS